MQDTHCQDCALCRSHFRAQDRELPGCSMNVKAPDCYKLNEALADLTSEWQWPACMYIFRTLMHCICTFCVVAQCSWLAACGAAPELDSCVLQVALL